MASAIVTGATGILGRGIVDELGAHPEEWKHVYAMSRSKKGALPQNATQAHLDLNTGAKEMAKEMAGVEAEYVFFAAYLDAGDADENTRVNGEMFENFLQALELAGIAENLRRVILVCGLKHYGVHLGVPKQPMDETDPWVREPPSNFYYRQQRSLHDWCARQKVEWVVTYSNEVLGFAQGNFMNLASALGIYAAVHAELGSELRFPGSEAQYTRFDCFTSTTLHADFCRWAALAPKAGNEAYNVVNGDIESWQNLWPKLAKRYNLHVPADQFSRPALLPSEIPQGPWAPRSLVAKEIGLEGRDRPDKLRQRTDLVQWSRRSDVRAAWERLAERYGLDAGALDKATWSFAAYVLGREYDLVANMTKARKAGYQGFVDSWECLDRVLAEHEEQRVLPPRKG